MWFGGSELLAMKSRTLRKRERVLLLCLLWTVIGMDESANRRSLMRCPALVGQYHGLKFLLLESSHLLQRNPFHITLPSTLSTY